MDGAAAQTPSACSAHAAARERRHTVHEPPALPTGRVSTAVQRQYRLDVTDLTFLPLGLDVQAWAYRVATADGRAYFLKLRRGGVIATALRVPRALADRAASH